MTHHTCWLRYHQFLIRYHRYVLCFWLLVTIVSAIFGPRFFSATSVQDDDLPGTPSYDANKIYRQYYPSQASQSSMVVLLSISDEAHRRDPNMTLTNTPWAYAFQQTFIQEMNTSWSHEIISIMGYYTYINTNMSAFASSFITDDERAMIISIDYNYDAPDANPFVHDVRNRVESIREHAMSRINTTGMSSLAMDVNSYDVGATGTELMIDDCADESEKDFINMDVIVLPIALLVLALYLSNLRLMIIPILSVGITLLTSCLIMYLVAIYMFKVASFTPSIMVSIIIAMSIDYSLFMLTRFKEEISHGRNLHDAVENMICQAGHVVLASGTTLTITFAGLIFLPLNFLQSCGIGAAAALICCMSVNLSITPCLLLTFGTFFSKFNIIPTCCYHHQPFTSCMRWMDRCRRRRSPTLGALETSHHIPLINTEDDESRLDDGAASIETLKQQQRTEMHLSRWYRIANLLTTTRYSIIFFIITLVCMIPICYYATEIRVSSDTNLLFPRDSSSAHVYQRMKTMFSPGTIDPYRIIMSTPDHSSVLTPDYYTACSDLIHTLLSHDLITNTSIRSITYVGGHEITYEQAMMIMYGGDKIPKQYQEEAMIYRALFHQLVSTNQTASIIQLETNFDPSGDLASNWISSVRDILTHPPSSMSSFSYHLVGGATSSVDALHEISRLFPILMISTTAIVFIIVAFLFRSLLVPVRLLFTITLGLSFVYGFAVLVFQHGILNAIFPVLRDVHAVYYYIPVMTFSILVGLSIDYDLFLAVRIAEYRRLGYTNRASIIKAIYKTGSIITAAGLIMTVAFGGLGIAQTMVLNQYGMVLCVAVLVDTFVVRTLLVPALFHLFGERGWWPGKMPPPQHDVDAFIELHDVNDPDPDLANDLAMLDATAPELSPDSYRRESDYHGL